MSRFLAHLLLGAACVAAAPSPLSPASAICLVVDPVVTVLRANPSATAFCSSFLSIQTATLTATATVTLPDAQATATISTTFSDSTTSTATEFETTTTTVTETDTYTSTVSTNSTTTSTLSCAGTATVLNAQTSVDADATTSALAKRYQKPTPSTTAKTTSSAKPASTTSTQSIPAYLTAWAPNFISTACSCLAVPTPSTTTTVTTTLPITNTVTSTSTSIISETSTISETTTSTLTETATSTASVTVITTAVAVSTAVVGTGLTYYQYANPYHDSTASSFNIAAFKNNNYALTGSIQNINTIYTPNWPGSQTTCNLPGQSTINCADVVVVFQGYFLAAQAGTYTFQTNKNTDNLFYMYHGDTAYSLWSDSNYDFTSAYPVGGSVSLTFAAGEVVPMTLLWANEGGPGQIIFYITAPNGTVYKDTTGFFTSSCSDGLAFSP